MPKSWIASPYIVYHKDGHTTGVEIGYTAEGFRQLFYIAGLVLIV